MKYFRYWIKEAFPITIDGKTEQVQILSGSNLSEDDARVQGKAQAKIIEERIATGLNRQQDYAVSIKEYLEQEIDEKNILTICRYGAKILNTTQYTFYDLDDYPVDFIDLFRSVAKLPKKERIVRKFLERIDKYPEVGSDFRIYETSKGIRVIGKTYVDPSSARYRKLMRKFKVDPLYVHMSQRQNCYRARVTPKPHRMKIKTIRIRSPLDCQTPEYKAWVETYEAASGQFSVVKFLQSVGRDFSLDPVIRLHDSLCGAPAPRALA